MFQKKISKSSIMQKNIVSFIITALVAALLLLIEQPFRAYFGLTLTDWQYAIWGSTVSVIIGAVVANYITNPL